MVVIHAFGVHFIGRLFLGIGLGAKDAIVESFTDEEITKAIGVRDLLIHCDPWSEHLKQDAFKKLGPTIKSKNVDLAKKVIDTNLTETSAPWCIDALKLAITFACTKFPAILKEALPTNYI